MRTHTTLAALTLGLTLAFGAGHAAGGALDGDAASERAAGPGLAVTDELPTIPSVGSGPLPPLARPAARSSRRRGSDGPGLDTRRAEASKPELDGSGAPTRRAPRSDPAAGPTDRGIGPGGRAGDTGGSTRSDPAAPAPTAAPTAPPPVVVAPDQEEGDEIGEPEPGDVAR